MRVAVTTLGCRLNQFESDALERRLVTAGHEVVEAAAADVHVINSCTITHEADAEARALVRRLRRDNPGVSVVVTGCYATAAAAEVAALPGVQLVVGNGAKDRLVEHLERLTPGEAPIVDAPPQPQPQARQPLSSALAPALTPRRSRAYLKIQDGCDYRCAFCIVPFVRGRSRSLAPEILVAQLRELVAAGAPEVVLTGVHLGTYGRDLSPRTSLVELLEALLPHAGPARLRLSSLDPHEVGDELVALLQRGGARLCRYLQLPVQSGDATVLRRMRRAHTVDDLATLVPRLVAAVPGIAIGSDVIVGFPGEGVREFDNTHALLAALPLAYLHVFSYSPRAGTAAAGFGDQVPRPEKARRSRLLRALSAAKQQAFAARHVGAELLGVVHKKRHPKTGKLIAITDNYLRVQLDGPDGLRGRLLPLRVEGAEAGGVFGTALL